MGRTMNGMHPNPSAVVVHFRRARDHVVPLARTNKDAAHTRLIVNPGIATEARVCQISVSTADLVVSVHLAFASVCAIVL